MTIMQCLIAVRTETRSNPDGVAGEPALELGVAGGELLHPARDAEERGHHASPLASVCAGVEPEARAKIDVCALLADSEQEERALISSVEGVLKRNPLRVSLSESLAPGQRLRKIEICLTEVRGEHERSPESVGGWRRVQKEAPAMSIYLIAAEPTNTPMDPRKATQRSSVDVIIRDRRQLPSI